jgi:hypothetical protein
LNSQKFGRILAASGKDRAIRSNLLAQAKRISTSIPCAEDFPPIKFRDIKSHTL